MAVPLDLSPPPGESRYNSCTTSTTNSEETTERSQPPRRLRRQKSMITEQRLVRVVPQQNLSFLHQLIAELYSFYLQCGSTALILQRSLQYLQLESATRTATTAETTLGSDVILSQSSQCYQNSAGDLEHGSGSDRQLQELLNQGPSSSVSIHPSAVSGFLAGEVETVEIDCFTEVGLELRVIADSFKKSNNQALPLLTQTVNNGSGCECQAAHGKRQLPSSSSAALLKSIVTDSSAIKLGSVVGSIIVLSTFVKLMRS